MRCLQVLLTALALMPALAVAAPFPDALAEEDRQPVHAVLYRLFSEILAERLRETDAELAKCRIV